MSSLKIDFRFVIYTNSDILIKPFYSFLKNKLVVKPYIPREKLLYELSKMDFLVNIENNYKEQFPSKLIDYALTKRPILSFKSKPIPINIINEFLSGNYQNKYIVDNLEQYDIRNVARKFIELST